MISESSASIEKATIYLSHLIGHTFSSGSILLLVILGTHGFDYHLSPFQISAEINFGLNVMTSFAFPGSIVENTLVCS